MTLCADTAMYKSTNSRLAHTPSRSLNEMINEVFKRFKPLGTLPKSVVLHTVQTAHVTRHAQPAQNAMYSKKLEGQPPLHYLPQS
mmetsp:Transcript_24682/g.53886  ORF Transcript_24682/g.53886 Transcript_24682/m.53886 type:complete len:85 (-) Transcript_24682:3380-3634(-)